ncbi:hypothetical protein OIU79_026472 [Salix purpurea]|uniref:Uncharacterized protein n=1 Tax=Salix purpurea TaxID=77065 RepID=A0A9Q1A0G1_SALPP|nr:hypothetical protein OIU79_026472 [Salix purpurea]
MKFLLDFVGCCGVSSCRGGPKEGPESVGGLSEETHALVELRRNHRRRKRWRGPSAAGNNISGAEWKPTLSAISENNVAAAVIGETGGGRLVKRKGWVGGVRDGGGRARDFVSLSSYVENYRRDRVLSVIPAFSPAPFMI